MSQIDIITFLWFIANHKQEDILIMQLEGLIKSWDTIRDQVEDIYVDKLHG